MSREGSGQNQRNGNALLAALTPPQMEMISRDLIFIEAPRREVLIAPHTLIAFVYFPVRGMVSLVRNMADGTATEIGVIGAEGMIGWPAIFGADMGSIEAMVQLPLAGYRLSVASLLRFLAVYPDFDEILRRSFHGTFLQVAQSAACNQHHTAPQRLAKWLLMADDRSSEPQMGLTHEFLGMMLGVRRASVTEAISALRNAGIVASENGRVSILDRPALLRRVCECYSAIQEESRRLAPPPHTP